MKTKEQLIDMLQKVRINTKNKTKKELQALLDKRYSGERERRKSYRRLSVFIPKLEDEKEDKKLTSLVTEEIRATRDRVLVSENIL